MLLRWIVVFILLFLTPTSAGQWRQFEDELDRFAAAHLNEVQLLSFRDGVEYCGYFGLNRSGELVATKPKKGKRNGCFPPFFLWGLDRIASYHTHGSYDPNADTEVPSVLDLESDFNEDLDGYVATPGGRLWVNVVSQKKTLLLCGRGCLRSDPNFVECDAIFPADEYTIPELFARVEDDTGEC